MGQSDQGYQPLKKHQMMPNDLWRRPSNILDRSPTLQQTPTLKENQTLKMLMLKASLMADRIHKPRLQRDGLLETPGLLTHSCNSGLELSTLSIEFLFHTK